MRRSLAGSDPATDNLRDALAREQHRIDDLFSAVLRAVEARDGARVSLSLGALGRRLLDHLRTEERHLLPRLAEAHPREAEILRADHADIRARLAALGLSIHAGGPSASQVAELASLVNAHGVREDELTYDWADTHLDPQDRIDLLERLRSRLAQAQDTHD